MLPPGVHSCTAGAFNGLHIHFQPIILLLHTILRSSLLFQGTRSVDILSLNCHKSMVKSSHLNSLRVPVTSKHQGEIRTNSSSDERGGLVGESQPQEIMMGSNVWLGVPSP